MLARPELLLPLAFSVSALLIVAALVMLAMSARQTRRIQQVGPSRSKATTQWKRTTTKHMFSGATVATLDELTRANPARQRQVRIYS